MTVARFKQDGNKYDISIRGHALFNPGRDPVCAACSILAYTLINVLNAEHGAEDGSAFDDFRFYTDKKDGVCTVKAKVKPERHGYIDTVISTVATGYALLMSEHPKHVKLKYYDANGLS